MIHARTLAPSIRLRLTVPRPLLIGLLAALACTLTRLTIAGSGWDLAWALRGARLLLAGQNPYTDPTPIMGLPLFYPLPTLLYLAPLAWLHPSLASIVFSGLSAGVTAWAVQRHRPEAWPLFLSAPFAIAIIWSQWAPLLCAAALIPALLPLTLAKPNLGLAVLLIRRPSVRSTALCAAIVLLSLAILPSWPQGWLRNTQVHDSAPALFSLPGLLLPLACLRWRDERARLLIGLALAPLRFYDVLLLWLIPRSARSGLLLSVLSWVVCGPWLYASLMRESQPLLAHPATVLMVALLYLPALALVLLAAPGAAPSTPAPRCK